MQNKFGCHELGVAVKKGGFDLSSTRCVDKLMKDDFRCHGTVVVVPTTSKCNCHDTNVYHFLVRTTESGVEQLIGLDLARTLLITCCY